MAALHDALFALDAGSTRELRSAVVGVWPPLASAQAGQISVREVVSRFAAPGAELRAFASAPGSGRWSQIDRDDVVRGVRERLRNPASVSQGGTDLCGPATLLFEFCRRLPTRYVRAVAELYDEGTFSTLGGYKYVAEPDLRGRPAAITACDWLIAATMRDDENLTEDVDDGSGMEGFTWPTEIPRWFEQVLGLRGELFNVYNSDEMDAMRAAQRAIDAGGVAVLLIDSDLIKGGPTDDEEDVWYRHRALPDGGWSAKVHSRDDNDVIPSHYVVLLGGVEGTDEDDRKDFRMRVWTWTDEYEITGSAEGVSEYVYWVLTGTP
ncbi:MAG: hypothetical protein ABMA64_21105 [Myxococcota bacterium]